ncbi:MAG: Gfo/Idh/MocA family oxidoreductase, partial [Pseudomonadota bacterium]
FQAMKAQIEAGAIGDVEMVTILSRDPGLPPIEYIKVSGGIFRDMMIHDFDMARWLIGEDFVEVQAIGSVQVDPAVGTAGDFDTATASMKTATGKIASITNSRRASYGYDQRIEVHGSKGMVSTGNVTESTMMLSTADGIRHEKPMHFFLERYAQAYANEWDGFVKLVLDGDTTMPSALDGLKSLELAEAAVASAS